MANHLSYDALIRVLERRASTIEQSRAQRHLNGCARCRSELEWLERIRALPDHGHGRLNGLQREDRVEGWPGHRHDAFGEDRGPAGSGGMATHWFDGGTQALLR
jgi:hypothetical protein